MGSYITLSPTKSAIIKEYAASSYNDHTSTECHFYDSSDYIPRAMLIGGFGDFPSAQKNKVIEKFAYLSSIRKEYTVESGTLVYPEQVGISAYILNGDFNESTVTKATEPDTVAAKNSDICGSGSYTASVQCLWDSVTSVELGYLKKAVQYGFRITYQAISGASDAQKGYVPTSRETINTPSLVVYFTDETNGFTVNSLSPSSGFVPKYSANTFSWGTYKKGVSYDDVTIASREFRWRPSGSSSYTAVSCSEDSCTIPANTFSTSGIQWCVSITDSLGNTVTSDWCTLSTEEETSTATADTPSGIILDNTIVNRFEWTHIIATGTLPTQSDLQISTDNSTWTTLATVTGSATYYDVPANTIATGQKYWRVRTYNTDSTAGAWSSSAVFISLGSPTLSGVSAENNPRPTIRWQCADFCGYQVKIPDVFDTGTKYGTVYSYKSPCYLEDGNYTALVRVINQYGIWSEWVTCAFSVSNTAGTAISATYRLDNSVIELSWTAVTGYSEYIVYRDGIPLCKTTGTSYTDPFAIGEHTYFVRGIYSSSNNYGLSNTISVNIVSENDIITLVDDIDWLSMEYGTFSISAVNYTHGSYSTTRHCTAAKYPVAEISKYRSTSVRGNVAFKTKTECDKFETMVGELVCLKTSKGVSVFGLLESSSKEDNTFYTDYEYSITRVEYDEEIDI